MARHAACLRLNFAMLDLLFALLDRELTLAKPNEGHLPAAWHRGA